MQGNNLNPTYINPKINIIISSINMVDHGLFLYQDNLWHNATLDHSRPWLNP